MAEICHAAVDFAYSDYDGGADGAGVYVKGIKFQQFNFIPLNTNTCSNLQLYWFFHEHTDIQNTLFCLKTCLG
jgi:hypothetical protein